MEFTRENTESVPLIIIIIIIIDLGPTGGGQICNEWNCYACKFELKVWNNNYLLGLSNIKDTVSVDSSALTVILSSLLAHFRILDSEAVSMPRMMFLSHLNGSNPSLLREMDTKLTWLLSIAWTETPVLEHSQFALGTKSLMASRIFLRRLPCVSFASNILNVKKCLTNWWRKTKQNI